MFQSEELDNHLKTSHTIETESVIYGEWNLNDTDNVEKIGNYRYRPGTIDNQFSVLPSTYDPFDEGGYYTGATDSSATIQSGFDDNDSPTLFTTKKEKMNLLYSLEDCIKPTRPRSGINKLLYLGNGANQYLDFGDKTEETQEILQIARRPRYYLSSRDDQFKYWTSYRTELVDNQEEVFGVSRSLENGISYIYDAAPFIVYKNEIPTNKIVVKMQTNVGDIDLGPFIFNGQEVQDPLYGFSNQTTPQRWRIEILKGDSWQTAISFDQNSTDQNGDPVIKSDGYVEISYGLIVPEQYSSFYVYAGEISSESLLPDSAPYGYTYLVKNSNTDIGELKFYDGISWITINPVYGWSLSSQTIDIRSKFITEINNPDYFIDPSGTTRFREVDFIRGIRIVAETMNRPNCTFDLIEFSPRLAVDLTDRVSSFSISKTMSDLGNGSIPVGSLFASTGTMELLDDDSSFNSNNSFNQETNTGSILSKYVDTRAQIKIYQVIKNVNNYDYFIPIKTMYFDEIPSVSNSTGIIQLSLRDMFFYLESTKAPEILLTNVSISYAITILLDFIGFSNYVFRRIEGLPEIIIPYFFVAPDQNVAEVLQQLAIASQTAMFFDEYNNFVVMSKEYLLPEDSQRIVDSSLYGQETDGSLPNIINLSSEDKVIYNEGRINYTTRYIQRAVSKYRQAPYTDRYKTYGYKPALLWEVSGKEQLRSQNEPARQSQGYVLSAAPLNTSLSEEVPVVVNNQVVNNILDVGENIDNISSYQGYLYANGEIIRYDAMEYAITGNLNDGEEGNIRWITNNDQYQRYFSKIPFNGKMYPTGNLRIYSEPEYEVIEGITRLKNGSVKKHGRGQFGTPITSHDAGLSSYWSDNANVAGCLQQAKDYLFNTSNVIDYPNLSNLTAGKINQSIQGITYFDSDLLSKNSTRNGIIKNFRANKYYSENEINYFDTARVGTLQSSALVFNGPEVPEQIKTSEFISYVYKDLPEPYKHFGTRMRIIGKIESTNQKSDTPFGAFPIYETQDLNIDSPDKNIRILGGSGGIAFGLNKETNNGYFFEIVSLTQDNIDEYIGANKENIVSYNIVSDPAPSCVNNVVTVRSETDIKFVVGQKLQFSGFVDSINPTDTRTPLNGEYKVTAINEDGKTFQYTIPGPSIANRTSTTGGVARLSEPGINNIANVYFYKNMSYDKRERMVAYSIQSNILTLYFETTPKFLSGERITVDVEPVIGHPNISGEKIVKEVSGNTVKIDFVASNLSKFNIPGLVYLTNPQAIPYKLWSGTAKILVDDGKFTGQYRFVGEENSTVYDLSAEYVNVGSSRRFYLYINNKQVATVTDTDPLPEYNNIGLFVRGTSKCMFENVYAIGANISQNSKIPVAKPLSKVFGDEEIDASESLRKYSVSGMIQKTYLSGISSQEEPLYNLYFDEFGTIMREVAYLNIKYDRAYPALYAKIMKTFNRLKGYAVSGFYAGAYGADFLIFNCQDTSINLDDTTGNFLRIQGITFTQNTTKTLDVNNFYKKRSSLSDPITNNDQTLISPLIEREEYNRIINSRSKYGISEFTIESPYIQTDDSAEDVFGWVIDKVSKKKILVGINTFATFNLQLGDLITIDYKNNDGIDVISSKDKKFVVYNIEHSKNSGEENMTMYLAEV